MFVLIWAYIERFESVDVEDSDELVDLSAGPEGLVDLDHDPVEQVGVDAFRESVSSENCLKNGKKSLKHFKSIQQIMFL